MGLTEEALAVLAGEQFFPQPTSSILDTEKKAAEPRPEFEFKTPKDTPFDMGELVSALESARNAAPGSDKITVKALRNLQRKA